MNLQYISDGAGKTTGVFIPIADWFELKKKFKGIEQEEVDVPDWQIAEVRERTTDYKTNPSKAINFDAALDELEKSL